MSALWRTVLAHDPVESPWRESEVLPGIAAVTGALSSFLEVWSGDRSLSSSLQLADFIDSVWADIAQRDHLRGPWAEVSGRQEMERWLTEPARRSQLEGAFEHYVDSPRASSLAVAADAWQWMTTGDRS